jgi:uncharacterized protein YybS (DUF2232 family)
MFLAGAVVPVLGGVAMLFAPIPVLGYSVGFPHALMRMLGVVGLTTSLVALLGGPMAGGAYALTFGLAAAVICYMLERRQPFESIVLCTTTVVLVSGTLASFALAGSPAALAQTLHGDLTMAMARGEKFYKMLGIDAAISPDARAGVVEAVLRLSPALATISAALMVLLNLGMFWRISGKQQRVGYMLFGDLPRWSAPEWLVWVLIATGFLTVFGSYIPIEPLNTIALDCFLCVAAVYFCQGLAIMAFYFRLLAMPSLARSLIYFVTLVQPVLAALVCAAGIFDLWIDFRRLKPPSREARNLGDFL